MSVRSTLQRKLDAAFSPEHLDIVDESHRHVGHAGHRPEGETHFRVTIVAASFAGKSRVERHRLVNAVLAEELAARVHALALKVSAPGEE